MSAAVHRSVGLRYEIILFPVTSEVIDLFENLTVMNLAVRRFDKAEFVDAREGRHRADKTNVWTFRSLDRTNPSVV